MYLTPLQMEPWGITPILKWGQLFHFGVMEDSIHQMLRSQCVQTRACGLHCHKNITAEVKNKDQASCCMSMTTSKYFIIVDCGVPDPPMDGTLGNYSHTAVGATVQFWCNEGFHPPDIRDSVCSNQGLWTPLPQKHNCRGKESQMGTEQASCFIIVDCAPPPPPPPPL